VKQLLLAVALFGVLSGASASRTTVGGTPDSEPKALALGIVHDF